MKENLNIEMGLRIRERREAMKFTREKLAEYIDVSPQFLAQIELGKRGMSTLTLYRICNTLHSSADYILLGKEKQSDLSHLNDMLSNLDDKHLHYIENIIRNFLMALQEKK